MYRKLEYTENLNRWFDISHCCVVIQ